MPDRDKYTPLVEGEDKAPANRRASDTAFPTFYRFVLSLVIVFLCFGYLFLVRPSDAITTIVFAFVGTTVSYWLLRKDGNNA